MKPKRKVAKVAIKRPYKLNEILIKRVGTILREAPGIAYESIANALGIERNTFHRWLKQGEEEANADKNTLFARFYLEANAAKYDGEIALLKETRKVSPQFILSRRFAENWPSERMQMELSGPGGRPLQAPVVQFVFAAQSSAESVYPPFTYSDESQVTKLPANATPEEIQSAQAKEFRRQQLLEAEGNAEAERARRAAITNGTVPGRLDHVLKNRS